MRVAISGTHCCGKSTLIDVFLESHKDYVHEIEAYEALQELHGEMFLENPSADDYYQQLEYNVRRIKSYKAGDKVIFERCPADYLAYLLSLVDLNRSSANSRLVGSSIDLVRDGIAQLDLIVLLRPENSGPPSEEDPKLRRLVDEHLENILLDDEFAIFTATGPRVVEALGATASRLLVLNTSCYSN